MEQINLNLQPNVRGTLVKPIRPGVCVVCGNPTEIIQRFIGFFGLDETYCTHCRECLPEEHRETHDDLVAGVKAARKAYEKKVRNAQP